MTEQASIHVSRSWTSRIVGGKSTDELAELLQGEEEIFLVYDKNVAWVAKNVISCLEEMPGQAGKAVIKGSIGLDTSEEGKSMETVMGLVRAMLDAGLSRKGLVVAVGGGITTDMAGFAAGIYKRGIRYANVPTTLLAQVDAAIGGKTGVNLDGYKNMLGTILQPEFTFVCAEVLRTLPPREFRSGLAELAKTFLLADAAAYASLLACAKMQVQPELIMQAARIKAGIVNRDPFEQGERALLNLGHTFAHAIEHEARVQGDDITHGEAVAMGIILAAELSERQGVAKIGLASRLKTDFTTIGLPVESPYAADVLRSAMYKDKKATGKGIRFVLLEEIARPRIVELSDF